ncbi:helix-turn-helix domain-containing protein [Rhizorhabdus wittichii]|uniref:Helix-turn-helix domain-containing protein n=1 Tax=Rhizorhabdus wittichii TaxID=160791 RepID=A0A975HDH4_9SPHN|nr:helix-turn-helix domain-containing protein [Rhizorhabdus wittichii]QTH19739.1 helix-turn-helix domain-containing protein [Rhizorhabdus wittichii]
MRPVTNTHDGDLAADHVYFPDEAAARLKMGKATLMKHVANGDVRVILVGLGKKRKHVRFAESDLRAFEDSRRCQFTPVRARPSSNTSSRSKVLDFEDLRRKLRGEQPSARKRGSGRRSRKG